MKTYIQSASTDVMPYEFEQLEREANKADYELKFTSPSNIEFIPKSDNCPRLIVNSHEYNPGQFTYDAKIKFPELNTEKFDGYDTMKYYTNIWNRWFAPFIEYLIEFQYDENSEI